MWQMKVEQEFTAYRTTVLSISLAAAVHVLYSLRKSSNKARLS